MNYKIVTTFLVILLFFTLSMLADDSFTRIAQVPMPEPSLNEGGTGNMVTNVDFDGDGKVDVYIVAHNWNDNAGEMTPRLYKYEFDGSQWQIVWACSVTTIELQNTWPALTYGDLDNDGKHEIIWGPVNWVNATYPNPTRLVVYEEKGDGSDEMGVFNGTNNYAPNAQTTITDQNSVNLRPFRFVVADVDDDNTDEVIFADRTGTSSGWYFGVLSVDDIPDNGDGSETWTVECNNLILKAQGDTIDAENKWDVAVMNNTIYLFDEVECSQIKWTGSAWDLLPSQSTVCEGAGSWKSAQIVDIDNDMTDELIVGTWYTSVAGGHGVWVYQLDADTLKGSKVADLSPWMSGYGVYGGAAGDIDNDGKLDYVFGSRSATPNGAIFRLEYQGGDITNVANYTLAVIDSEFATSGGRWGVIGLADMDADNEQEVFYTSSVPAGGLFGDEPQPVVVLDPVISGITGEVDHFVRSYVLSNNFPNPFNPETHFTVTLAKAGDIAVRIYDIQGREVVTLFNGYKTAAEHTFTWKGLDANSARVASGTYIYALEAEGKTLSKKMVLIK